MFSFVLGIVRDGGSPPLDSPRFLHRAQSLGFIRRHCMQLKQCICAIVKLFDFPRSREYPAPYHSFDFLELSPCEYMDGNTEGNEAFRSHRFGSRAERHWQLRYWTSRILSCFSQTAIANRCNQIYLFVDIYVYLLFDPYGQHNDLSSIIWEILTG